MIAGGSGTAAENPPPGPPTRRLTRWVHRNLPRPSPPALGDAQRRPRVPPMDYRDNRPATRQGGPYCTPIWGPGSTPIYTLVYLEHGIKAFAVEVFRGAILVMFVRSLQPLLSNACAEAVWIGMSKDDLLLD